MAHYYIFNGDADGICALQQLRLHNPNDAAVLVTGVKRDISLVKQVSLTAEDTVDVLDISLDKNRDAVVKGLETGAKINYYDHHFPGEIPEHPNFNVQINTQKDTCTSLIVNGTLDGAHELWAIAGAFGDNFDEPARGLAERQGLNAEQTEQLKKLGEAINYNAYGGSLDDLHITPQDLCKKIRPYASPLEFIAHDEAFTLLTEGYRQDLSCAHDLKVAYESDKHAIYLLPDEAWARRVSGVFANTLAKSAPTRAHAMLTVKPNGNYLVSVRAPITTKTGADELCRQFETGGGRQAAAGINDLKADDFDTFKKAFIAAF